MDSINLRRIERIEQAIAFYGPGHGFIREIPGWEILEVCKLAREQEEARISKIAEQHGLFL